MAMNDNQYLRPGERIDDLQRGYCVPQENVEGRQNAGADQSESGASSVCGLRIIQNPALFCFGMDAVLLSAYVQMKKARRGLDLGTGNGIIPILLSDRTDCVHLTGLEIQPASVDIARRSICLNGLQDRISVVQGDIREADRIFAAASFDFITCNPPYRAVGSGRISGTPAGPRASGGTLSLNNLNGIKDTNGNVGKKTENPAEAGSRNLKQDPVPDLLPSLAAGPGVDPLQGLDPRAVARHELLCTFEDVANAAAKLLRPGGHFYLVHRPMRLPGLITTLCGRGLEPKRMRFVYPHADQAPNMVLFDCVRGAAPELRVEPPLIVYEKDGTYTPELLQIYYG